MSRSLLLLTAASLGVVAVVVVERLVRDTVLAAWLIAATGVVTTALNDLLPAPQLGGFTVVLPDLVCGLVAVAAIARVLRAPSIRGAPAALLALGAVVVLSLVRGAAVYGLQAAVNDGRTFVYVVFGALYFALAEPTAELRERVGRVWFATAVALLGVVAVRWLALVAGLPLEGVLVRPAEAGAIRVIDNQDTLILAVALLGSVPLWSRGALTPFERRAVVALVPVVILLNHRTIWIATVVGVVVLANRNPQLGRTLVTAIGIVALLGGVAIAALQNVEESPLPQAPTSLRTFLWRYEGWRALVVDGDHDPVSIVLGQPFGGGYAREVFGYRVDVAPHNFYLQTYLRSGLLGLAALGWLLGSTVAALRRAPPEPPQTWSREALLVGVVLEAVFLTTWAPNLVHGILIGLAAAAAAAPGGAALVEFAGPVRVERRPVPEVVR